MSSNENALILLYHRVTTPERDPQMLCVSPENFRLQMEVLRRRGLKVVPLRDLADAIEEGRVPSGAVAITFDDGYADNLTEAAPLLREYEAPATVFATTAYTNCDAEFYWDDLDRILLSPGSLPRYLRLWLADNAVEVDLEHFDYYPHSTARANKNWTILDENDPTPRHTAYREICKALHHAPLSLRRDALNQLQAWAGIPMRRTHRMLSVDEMRALTGDGLIDLGGHTIDHPVLSQESESVQKQEIAGNRDTLKWVLGREPLGFSYPYGTKRDFTAATIEMIKRAGYGFACANFTGPVTAASNPYQLPRQIVRNWNAAEFEMRLDVWLAAEGVQRTRLAKVG
jgi:peptidoglycan/xylan/chitin deacetylase (PgdA/CDA1 family)